VRKFRDLKPDLVLLDLGMPDIDGIEVGRQMHAIDPSIPLILFTLSDAWGLEGPARKAGISRVICKTESWKLMASIKEIVFGLGAFASGRCLSETRAPSVESCLTLVRL